MGNIYRQQGTRSTRRIAGWTGAIAALSAMMAGTTLVANAGVAGAAAPSPASPGITKTSVTVGQVSTLSGPVPGLFLGAKVGTEAYFDYINSKGGINGRKLHLVADDDQFSAANYVTDTAQLVRSTFALVGGFSLFDASGVPAINAARIPDVTVSLSTQRNENQFNYSPFPVVDGGAQLGPLKYVKKEYGSAYKSVGVLTSSNSTAVSEINGEINAMKSLGYNITYYRAVSSFEDDFTPDVLHMKAAGVQIMFPAGLAVSQLATLAKEMQQQSFRPTLFIDNGGAYNTQTIAEAGAQAVNGLRVIQGSSMYLGQDARSVPAVRTFLKWVKRADPSAAVNNYTLYGWSSAELFSQALESAGKNPTRASVLAALAKIKSFSAGGLSAPTDPAQKTPASCWLNITVANGQWKRAQPSPKSGYICSPGGLYFPKGYSSARR
jgi:ABC-type branched-subunit amino acid transport system substrate-binding protein